MSFTEEILTGEVPSTPYARLMGQSRDFGARGLAALQVGDQSSALELFACQSRLFDMAQQIAMDMTMPTHVGLAAKWVLA
jgi:hypothetical protein